jgi:acylpyruvate hydrolase
LPGFGVFILMAGAFMPQADFFGVAPLVSFLSHVATLEPGDVIACGTPSGVGFTRTPPLWMAPGDVCEVEIERIGRLRNPVVQD